MKNPYAFNPFNAMKSRSPDVMKREDQLRYEHALVYFTLGRIGLSTWRRKLASIAEQESGVPGLTFRTFNSQFHDFPVQLGCNHLNHLPQPLHLLQSAILPVWFRSFARLPFMPCYEEFYDSLGAAAADRPVGMVFPRHGFQQGLIIHNGDFGKFVPPAGSCHVYFGRGKNPMALTVQPYSGFLDTIYNKGHGWRYEE